MDIMEIVKKVMGDKDLMDKVKSADVSEVTGILKKANIDIKDDDVEKVKSAITSGNFDLGALGDLAGGFLGKK